MLFKIIRTVFRVVTRGAGALMFSSGRSSYSELFKENWSNVSTKSVEKKRSAVDKEESSHVPVIIRTIQKKVARDELELFCYPLVSGVKSSYEQDKDDTKKNQMGTEYSLLSKDDDNGRKLEMYFEEVERIHNRIKEVFETSPVEKTIAEWYHLQLDYKNQARARSSVFQFSLTIAAYNFCTACLDFSWKKNEYLNENSYLGYRSWQIPYTFSDEEIRCSPAILFYRLRGQLPLLNGFLRKNPLNLEQDMKKYEGNLEHYKMLSIPLSTLTLTLAGDLTRMSTYKMKDLLLEGNVDFTPNDLLACVIRKDVTTEKYEACFLVQREECEEEEEVAMYGTEK